ncbi:MAG: DNA translocase FtsK [Treponematales bacterium]
MKEARGGFVFRAGRYRRMEILSSLGLAVIAAALGVSILRALFTGAGAGAGDFFVRAYGLLACVIPAYLFCAAGLLASRRYRPGRIFVLTASSLPFLTLALGCALARNIRALEAQHAFFAAAGKAGVSFLFVSVTFAESLAIAFFRKRLFSRPSPAGTFIKARTRRAETPPPRAADNGFPASPVFRAAQDINDVYVQAAALRGEHIPDIPARKEGGEAGEECSSAEEYGVMLRGDMRETAVVPEEEADEDEAAEDPRALIKRALANLDTMKDAPVSPPEAREASAPQSAFVTEEAEPDEFAEDEALDDTDAAANSDNQDVEDALALAEEEAARHAATARRVAAPIPAAPRPLRQGPYSVPVGGILNQYPDGQYWIIDDATREAAITLKETLREFNIQAEVTGIRKGPVITMFEILPAPGVKLSKIVNLQDNIALRLAASSVRIVAPIPGKHAVGIEVPNAKRNIVSFREIIEAELHKEGRRMEVPVVLGKDITGEAVTVDLVSMPHLLIAGATGAGKSVCVNTMILSILYQRAPQDCRLILIDPKIVELKLYNGIPHLLTPVITEPKRAFQALQYCIYEMERRYACLDSMGVRDLKSYNRRIREKQIAAEHIPYIVVVIDEFADLMATTGKELESTVARLAAMSRAVGIHLVLATQRPSIDVITGLIKANIPSRIAFMVASKMDSRIIIDMVGAEKLLGKGDMLYSGSVDPFPIRMQGAFVSEEEVERVVDYVKTLGEPDYIDDEMFFDDEEDEDGGGSEMFGEGEDPLYDKAMEIVVQQGKASASYIQRRLKIGYNRAARLVEEMEHRGVVGPAQGSRPRELLRGV